MMIICRLMFFVSYNWQKNIWNDKSVHCISVFLSGSDLSNEIIQQRGSDWDPSWTLYFYLLYFVFLSFTKRLCFVFLFLPTTSCIFTM